MPFIRTSRLDVAYEDDGPARGPAVLLLHGWPDDATTWNEVAPALNDAGFRTITPTLRGFGSTRFRSPSTPRTGNTAIIAIDAIELLDALGIDAVCVGGHDWGANVAETMAVGWPGRVQRIVLLSTPSRLGGVQTPPLWHARLEWYHWLQATKRGEEAVRQDPLGFARIMWDTWSPQSWFDEATFETVSRSFENPDWIAVTLHSYRSRWEEAGPDPDSEWLDTAVKSTQTLALDTLYIHGAEDGVNPPKTAEGVDKKFVGDFRRVMLEGVGHFPTREAPEPVATMLIEHFSGHR